MNSHQPLLTSSDLLDFDRYESKASLAEFTRLSWPVLEPAQELRWGWALDAMCEHLEAVTAGDLRYLIINVPPGMMKSLLCSVIWPAWEWGPLGAPWTKWIKTSYADRLSRRDNRRARMLIDSDWYRARWPITFSDDQNQVERFENKEGLGFMIATSTKGTGTGERGHKIVIDDPNNVKKAESAVDRGDVHHYLGEVLPSRTIDKTTSRILIQQRTHVEDATGFCLEAWPNVEHLVLPMEFEADRRCSVLVTGFTDPRTEEGELLFPERFDQEAVEELKHQFRQYGGTYAEAGQLQQRPAPRKGGMFQVENFEIVDAAPSPFLEVVRYWDKAGTDGGGAYTAGVRMGLMEDGRFIVLDVVRRQLSTAKREAMIQTVAAKDGVETKIWMEQEPGSGGKDSVLLSISGLAGYTARRDRVNTGDKEHRAGPLSASVEIGAVLLLRGEWNKEFIEELRMFPAGKYKDQVDASSGAYNKLVKTKQSSGAVLGAAGVHTDNPVRSLSS